MKKILYSFLFIVLVANLVVIYAQTDEPAKNITIFMIGNSTMADKPLKDGNPEKGWGQIFPLYFSDGIKIENHAVNGRSTKSFIDEGRWDTVVPKIKPGDYVIMEFGHNDAKKDDPKRFADANTDYKWNLQKFINETRQRGGIPILATPIVRRRFDELGKFYDVHGDYPNVVRDISVKMNVLLLDLHKKSEEYIIKLGEERSKGFYLHIDADEYNSLPNRLEDNTHLSPCGAFRICDFAADEIKLKIPQLARYLKN
ncbi:MAG: rhamnogalacturonan acetylesterase [Ignavibacteriales bacterium]|nr:rhamnogalacturonan acetylesterase [Ignavibacteriales bacterium]